MWFSFPKMASKTLKRLTDEEKAGLNRVHQVYLKRLEETNKERVGHVKTFQYKNRLLGCSLLALSVGIYIYTMRAIKQENLGEEYDRTYKDDTAT